MASNEISRSFASCIDYIMLIFLVVMMVQCGALSSDKTDEPAKVTEQKKIQEQESPQGNISAEKKQTFIERYIKGDTYQNLVLEIDHVPGFAPDAAVTDDLRAELSKVLDKPGEVSASLNESIASKGADHAWTIEELDSLADETFDLEIDTATTKIHVLFVDGHYSKDTDQGKVLGVAWKNKNLVMFKQTISNSCASSGATSLLSKQICDDAEYSVWLHEIGHVIGLVDNGLDMVDNHKDEEHGAHDNSRDCVMYWAYEGSEIIDTIADRILGGKSGRLSFDQACVNDIVAGR